MAIKNIQPVEVIPILGSLPVSPTSLNWKVMLSNGQKGTVCLMKPKLQLPSEDMPGFVAQFWLVEETKIAKEANMAPYTPPESGFHVLRNSKLIEAGTRLYRLAKETGEARDREARGGTTAILGGGTRPTRLYSHGGKRKRS